MLLRQCTDKLLMAMRMEAAVAHANADAILNGDSLDVAQNVLVQLYSCGVPWGSLWND